MTKTMTPSKNLTDGQVAKIKENLGEALRKANLQSEPAQQVLKTKGQGNLMIADMVAVVRRYVEAVSDPIVRLVKVNRTRNPQEALDATGRKQYTDRKVVDNMPRGEGDEAEVVFFKISRYVTAAELEEQYKLRGLKPVDAYSLAAVNEADPAFANEHPNATHWQDADGRWCYAAFYQWRSDERRVIVYRHDYGWHDIWCFAGRRQ